MIEMICIFLPPLLLVVLRHYLQGTLDSLTISLKNILEYLLALLFFTFLSFLLLVLVFRHTGEVDKAFSQYSMFVMHYLCMAIFFAVAIPFAEYIIRTNIALSHMKHEDSEISLNNSAESAVSNKRSLVHIEFLRIICCYLVMFNHTDNNGFFLFSIAKESNLYWIYMFISIGCKVAVPIFLMISGALLLGKDESIKDIYCKRIFKFVIILIAISVLYQIYDWKYHNAEFHLASCLKTIYSNRASVALWYLYSYISVLTMLPFLRKMVRLMETRDYLYLAAGHVCIVGIIPVTQYYLSNGTVFLNGNFSAILFTASNIFFVIMGYFFEKILKNKYFNWKNALALVTLSVLCIILSCIMTQYKADLTGVLSEAESQTFHNALIAIPTFTVYYLSKMLFMKVRIGTKILKCIQFVGSTTFGVYLFERILRERMVFIFNGLKPIIRTMPACLIYIFACLAIGVVIVGILKKIPIIRKYI